MLTNLDNSVNVSHLDGRLTYGLNGFRNVLKALQEGRKKET
jgi:hypothetical protein